MTGDRTVDETDAIPGTSVWAARGWIPASWFTPTAGFGDEDAGMTPGKVDRRLAGGGGNLSGQIASTVWPNALEIGPPKIENEPGTGLKKRKSPFRATPGAPEPEIPVKRIVDRDGHAPENWNQRLFDRHTGRLVQDGRSQPVRTAETRFLQEESCRLWPTPTQKITSNTDDPADLVNKEGKPWQLGEKPYDRRTGKPVTTALADAVRAEPGAMWLAPRTEGFDAGPHRGKNDSLPAAVKAKTKVDPNLRPKLCAAWVTRLMGYPDGWLDLDENRGAGTGKTA